LRCGRSSRGGADSRRRFPGNSARAGAPAAALPDAVTGLDYAHAYHSATETARVGGDFYDLFELADDQVGIVIGDVAGKGLDAAVLTSVVKNTIRAHANEPGKMPGRILELTNEILYRSTAPDSFVTVFFGILDRKTGTLVYANGGHTTAAIALEDGSIRGLSVTGSVLGAVPRIRVEEEFAQVTPSSLLMLYTDGLTEARSESALYGETRLFGVLSTHAGESPQDVLRAVIEDVMLWSGSHLRDDMALLALKRVTPAGEPD
jgi:serine phosphatase RsbU (regulator of sigma subunit)